MLLRGTQCKVVANGASHNYPIGTVITITGTSTTIQGSDGVSDLGTRNFYATDLEVIPEDKQVEMEDPKTIRVRTLKAKAEILTKVDGVDKLDEARVDKLVRLFLEFLKAGIDRRIAMRAISAASKLT